MPTEQVPDRPGPPLAHSVFLAELVYAAARIDDLLLARVKRMAGRAHLDREVFAERGTRRKLVAATTAYLDFMVAGMNFGFHYLLSATLESAKRARTI